MLGQILKASLVLILLSYGCKKAEAVQAGIPNLKYEKQQSKDTIVKILDNKVFSLKIKTHVSNDTLDVDDYKKDKYSSPIIIAQEVSFFKQGKILNSYKLPIKTVMVKTINKTSINILHTPIYKVCIVRNSKEDFYVVNGAEYDYCNGSDCLEFIGIYSMSGDKVYEGYSDDKKKVSLRDALTKNQIEFNKLNDCIKIDDFR